MRALILAAGAVLLLCGFPGCNVRPNAPIPAQCDAVCFVPCVGKDEDTGVRVTGNPDDAGTWDEIGGDALDTLARKLRTCDVGREACVKCLNRLDKAKVIDLGRDP
jgi:hypothetical protein